MQNITAMQRPAFRFWFDGPSDHPNASLSRATEESAGFDMWTKNPTEHVYVEQTVRRLIDTGIHVQIPPGWVGILKTRSSMAKQGFTVEAGVIDSDYRGPVKVMLSCDARDYDPSKNIARTGPPGIRVDCSKAIAQLLLVPHGTFCAERVADLSDLTETIRGNGGFGSTDAPQLPGQPSEPRSSDPIPHVIVAHDGTRSVWPSLRAYNDSVREVMTWGGD
jgi:dUTP pyrophosphatase